MERREKGMRMQNAFVSLCDCQREMNAAMAAGFVAAPSSYYLRVAEHMDGLGLSRTQAGRLFDLAASRQVDAREAGRRNGHAAGMEAGRQAGREEAIASFRLKDLLPLFWREIKRLTRQP
jgi:hypothetical protein